MIMKLLDIRSSWVSSFICLILVVLLALLTPVSSHEILQVEQLGIVPVEPRLGKLGSVVKSMARDNAMRLIRILTVSSTRVLPRRSSVEMMEVNMNL